MITASDAWKDLQVQQARQAELAGLAEKRRKHGRREEREEREGHDMRGEEPPALAGARDAAQAEMNAGHAEAEAARKAIAGLEADPGPGSFREPGAIEPQQFSRPYLDTGHSAASPQHGPPNLSPMPPEGRGILTPLELSAEPVVVGSAGPITASMAQHRARAAASMPSMPIPRGAA